MSWWTPRFHRCAQRDDDARGHGRRLSHSLVCDFVHGWRTRDCTLLRVSEPFRVFDAGADSRGQPPVLFVGWEGVGLCSYLAHRLLVREGSQCRGGEESVHRQSGWGLRTPLRDADAGALHGCSRLERHRQWGWPPDSTGRPLPGSPVAARWRSVPGHAPLPAARARRHDQRGHRDRPCALLGCTGKTPRYRSTCGFPMRWRGLRRSLRSSMRRRW